MGNFSSIIQQDRLVLVDFYAEWCEPCKLMGPILKEVKDVLGDAVLIFKINVDINQITASKYNVRGVPTLVLFKSGKQLWRQSGIVHKGDLIDILKGNS
ncbi:thioredoxin [Flavobacteriales bacterium 34_180_T64]|nr:thioredoxin [Flavobacteriales bacterium 34_180_T64]